MDTFRDAAASLATVRKKYPEMQIKITIEEYGARIHATLGIQGIDRSVSWLDMEYAHANVLAICVGDVARQLVERRAA
jgi:hypothetical protein